MKFGFHYHLPEKMDDSLDTLSALVDSFKSLSMVSRASKMQQMWEIILEQKLEVNNF